MVYGAYESRKIILSTNIAETSVTIGDVVFVIDSGRAKYKIRDECCVKYQIGFISKSSARQRMGRAGRVAPGVCFRMYSGDTYESFEARSVPQIFLEPLDGTILQLKAYGVQNVFAFPFISPLGVDSVRDALASLEGLGALNAAGNVTGLGHSITKFFIAPRVARMLCLKNSDDIFHPLAIVASILSVNFEVRKTEETRDFFANRKSDLLVFLDLYLAYTKAKSKRTFAMRCGMSLQVLQEITKLSKYLINISGRRDIIEYNEISEEQASRLCKLFYISFSDQLAVASGTSYDYRGGDVFISRDSIDANGENVVFEHIACGKNRDYIKNITVIDKNWF